MPQLNPVYDARVLEARFMSGKTAVNVHSRGSVASMRTDAIERRYKKDSCCTAQRPQKRATWLGMCTKYLRPESVANLAPEWRHRRGSK